MEFCDRLKGLRKENKLERDQLANKIGVSYFAIAKWETGDRHPDYEMLKRVADFFGVSRAYLLGDTDFHNPEPFDIEEDYDELYEKFKKHWNNLNLEERQEIYSLTKRLDDLKNGNEEG